MKSSKHILLELLSKSLVLEQEEKEEKEEKTKKNKGRPPKEIVLYDPDAKSEELTRLTNNALSRGRPPNSVRDSREMAADPSRAKELLDTLGASISGGSWAEKIQSLYTSASGHEDFGKVVLDAEIVHNKSGEQKLNGVAVNLSGEFKKDEKQIYFFVRSLYTAALRSEQLSISSALEKIIRLEHVDGTSKLLFYPSKKAQSFN